MNPQPATPNCSHCRACPPLNFQFTMAFQPIVNCRTQQIYGYEALVRGLEGESAASILAQVDESNRYPFDQLCRIKAITLASQLGLNGFLSINFLPNAIKTPESCIRATLNAANQNKFPLQHILFEFTEGEQQEQPQKLTDILTCYHSLGFSTAIDDFGSGYSGLSLLRKLHTDLIKLDMDLVRDIHLDPTRQAIVKNCLQMFRDLNCTPLAEGIESVEEMVWFMNQGVELMQGYLFAKPGLESLPTPVFPSLSN